MALVTSVDSDILTGLGDQPGADMTARLLLALTALYAQRPSHTAEEQQQYIELALRLIDKVEPATRTAVACILQRHPDAPAEVLERLGGTQSSRDDAPEIDQHWAHDQHRAHDQHASHDQYVSSDRNPSSHQNLTVAECAPMRSRSEDESSEFQRSSTMSDFGEAFFAATRAERRRLLASLACGGEDEVAAVRENDERAYGRLDVAALHGRIGEFTREFERLIEIPKSLCERILNDPSGEPMVIAAKAAGMPIAILQRILLLVNPAVSHSVQRVYDLTELYHGLDRGAARDLLALWRMQAKPNDPTPLPAPASGDRKAGALRDTSVASLRSRFGALTERLQGQAVNERAGPGNVARRGLRSR